MDIGPPELLIIAAIILVLFGGSKLPQLARSLGKAKNEFHQGLNEGEQGSATVTPAPTVTSAPSVTTVTPPAPSTPVAPPAPSVLPPSIEAPTPPVGSDRPPT